jgi:ribose-phosphate pyrophosphokinase
MFGSEGLQMLEKMRVFSGNANVPLARKICENLGISLGQAHVTAFSDGETRVEINENVRGMDVFIIQPTCSPVNITLMELLIMIDAARRSSAERITAVIPYYGYARQDRKVAPRAPITAKLVADLITQAGATPVRSRASSIFPWIISLPPPCFWTISRKTTTVTTS